MMNVDTNSAPGYTLKLSEEREGKPTGDLRRLVISKVPTFSELSDLAKTMFRAGQPVVLRYVDPDGDKITIQSQPEFDAALQCQRGTLLRFIVDTSAGAPSNSGCPARSTNSNASPQDILQSIAAFAREAVANNPSLASFLAPLPGTVPVCPGGPAGPAQTGTVSGGHTGVQCDGCQTLGFTGTRYKCCECSEDVQGGYDLCEGCYQRRPHVHNQSHHFVPITVPVSGRLSCKMASRHLKEVTRAAAHACPAPFCGMPYAPYPGYFGPQPGVPQTQTGDGQFDAEFVDDLTLEDGTVVELGKAYSKIWRVRNSGRVAWPGSCLLRFVGGDLMCAPVQIPVPPVAPGACTDLVLEVTATEPRHYYSYWSLASPTGHVFGNRLWVDVIAVPPVDAAKQADATMTAPPSAPPAQQQPEVPSAPVVAPQTQQPEVPSVPMTPQVTQPQQVMVMTPEESRTMETLQGMGFNDATANINVIRANGNNLEAVLYALLGTK